MFRTTNLVALCCLAVSSIAAAQDTVVVSQKQREAVEQAVRRHFPDLDDDVLAGWVDAYADLSPQELEQLLLQKSLVPTADGAASFLSEYTVELPSAGTASQQSYFKAARTILRHNILHAETPGYRRRTVNTMVTEPSAGGDSASIALTTPSFDFTPANRTVSQSPLHVALADKYSYGTMFRLEPGCILTRFGRFERLEDGRLGLKVGTQSLALYGDITIPADGANVYIDTTGLVTSVVGGDNGEKSTRLEYGRIPVAAVYDMSVLQSNNGVFFKVPVEEIGRSVTMASKISLTIRALENSNVDVEKERSRLKRIELLDVKE